MVFAVEPRRDCPHVENAQHYKVCTSEDVKAKGPCVDCGDDSECWLCLSCHKTFCSRYVEAHGAAHAAEHDHCIALSFSDLSVWCYECDSYITAPALHVTLSHFHKLMHGVEPPARSSESETPPTATGDSAGPSSSTKEESTASPDPAPAAESPTSIDTKSAPVPSATTASDSDSDNDSDTSEDEPRPPPVLDSFDIAGIVDYIKKNNVSNIVVLSGAGVSTSAGIPDFRTPGTGLYDNLQEYDLPEPTAIFSLDYFREKPEPFFTLAKELYPGNFNPTLTHYFIRLLHEKGMLLRNYTQNVDTLERVAGIPDAHLVEAHGSFSAAHCIECKQGYGVEWVRDHVMGGTIPRCTREACRPQGLVKPDIVFFGESLPEMFFERLKKDFPVCDLAIVIGSSLQVAPFSHLINLVPKNVPRVLINREAVGEAHSFFNPNGFLFGDKAYRDVALLGDCDDICRQLADALGMDSELTQLMDRELSALKDNPGLALSSL